MQESAEPADNEVVDAMCSLCGRVADPMRDGDPPMSWCADVVEAHGGKRTRWVCPECTRAHVRAIEAKLEQTWW
jgi:hypothetical protein